MPQNRSQKWRRMNGSRPKARNLKFGNRLSGDILRCEPKPLNSPAVRREVPPLRRFPRGGIPTREKRLAVFHLLLGVISERGLLTFQSGRFNVFTSSPLRGEGRDEEWFELCLMWQTSPLPSP